MEISVQHIENLKQIRFGRVKSNFHLSYLLGWAVYCYGGDFWNKLVERRKQIQAEEEDEESEPEEDGGDETSKEEEDTKRGPLEVTDENREGNPPKTTDLVYLSHKACVMIFDYQVSWLEALRGIPDDSMGLWLYSLLTRLEKPLEPDVGSAIRTMSIGCSRQRAALIQDNKDLTLVTTLTLLICIGTKYFGQEDLADSAK